MSNTNYVISEAAWCPGCGNFNILEALKNALEILGKKPHEVLIVGGIGQAAKTPQYINTNGFCGLHGRALPAAVGAKMVNKDLTVIVHTGDGDSYGEGGNHFIHNIRRNVDITHFVHDNQIYGLTKGQASPTTDLGHVTEVQVAGNINPPLNPVLLAIALGAGFVARAFSGDKEHLTSIMVEAIKHKGYSLVDILQPCVSFNKVNTFQWYSKRVYKLDESYDPTDKLKAMEKAMEWGDRIPIGIIYREEKPTYCDKIEFLREGPALIDRPVDIQKIKGYLNDFI
ncbi:2-oxoacid:ferredoxin oxidoreductase subunit beta [Caldicoprobacter faecalis]|uniref:2-oxoglutarate ferredoxin oxidoreductase subunit beta n=1 Tax=Caldicoprobacter faecalis TaxID=937334 RepID=A0A1I5UXM0_9FIRM|nr:2-oxoacid:ferredoxin oxidoreductase subunit beta [Caldicoprobacter faecalis]SFQ00064.1 2-oxoglutarate ferredoxin oxidoreductase subunit beta [Caldicoprobacter faecalis]